MSELLQDFARWNISTGCSGDPQGTSHQAQTPGKKTICVECRVGTPGPKVIGVDEISIRKGHTYRIVVSDLVRRRPFWFGDEDRSQPSMDQFYQFLGQKKA